MARRQFSSQSLVLIVIAIAINMVGGQLISMVKLPIFSRLHRHHYQRGAIRPDCGNVNGITHQPAVGVTHRSDRCRLRAGSHGYRAGRRMAGTSRMVSYLTESGVQRRDHYLAVTVVAVPIRTTLFGGVTGSGADLFVAGCTRLARVWLSRWLSR